MTDTDIEIWRFKKLITELEAARGNRTNMISLIIASHDQISRVDGLLAADFVTASHTESRVNRQYVLRAITSARLRLRRYRMLPRKGLVIYTGTTVTDEQEEKTVIIEFEPFKRIDASLYLRDNTFHTEALVKLLESDDIFGFIVMDGNETLFGKLRGDAREVLHKSPVDGLEGQSAPRFECIETDKRHYHVRKTAQLATQFFIDHSAGQPNVSGLIIAGPACFTTELSHSNMFDPCLRAIIMNVVGVSYGGQNVLDQAIESSSEILANVKLHYEKRLLRKFFNRLDQDDEKYVFGVDDTLNCLQMGAVEVLIVWESLDISRYVLKNSTTGEIVVKHLNKDEEGDQSNFRDPDTNAVLEVQEKSSLLGWLAEYDKFRFTLEFVTDRSHEGLKFCKDLLGVGGILRYQLDQGSH
ncbi:hypothetical protein SSX86_015399 [Deinandra increscens subsp. villosa]|uniref:eRF1/Pelota-like N-terminal domain-containing protein n=1 Tax=Deinandra increscens subsp. villosa TaxID=3103831 RepID=A0AAP0GZ76_9ASTR